MLAELLRTDGVKEHCVLRSRIGFMAFHGGSLEVMTDVIAEQAAEASGASFYAIRQPWGFRWHIPSKRIDPSQSPAMQGFLDHVEVAIAVHGWGTDGFSATPARPRRDRPILVGGRHRAFASVVARELRAALPAYRIEDDIERIPPGVRGLDPRNPVNLARSRAGVQLELTPRVRGLPPFWTGEQRGRGCPDTRALIAALASAARAPL